MKFNFRCILKTPSLLFLIAAVVLSCNNSGESKADESKTAAHNIKNINLRRHPLPYPPAVDTLPIADTVIKNNILDSLFAERDSLQTRLMSISAEAIRSEVKTKNIEILEKLFDLNTDKIVKLQSEESICRDIDDSQPVEMYNGALGVTKAFVEKMSRSVGQLQWKYSFGEAFSGPNDSEGNVKGVRWCTGTLIDRNVFITAGHCFDGDGNGWNMPMKGGKPISSEEIARLMKVNFNYQVDKLTGRVRSDTIDYPVEELKEYRNGNLDYAIITLGKDKEGRYPGERFGFVEISKSTPSKNDMTAIIQHPLGKPKVVEAGTIFSIDFNLLNYDDIDTQGGSSGAAVISTATNKIVGIHVLGGCDNFRDGSNHATPIFLIIPNSEIVSRLAK